MWQRVLKGPEISEKMHPLILTGSYKQHSQFTHNSWSQFTVIKINGPITCNENCVWWPHQYVVRKKQFGIVLLVVNHMGQKMATK